MVCTSNPRPGKGAIFGVQFNADTVREGLAAQKTPKARATYRQEHEADLLRSEAAVRFFKAKGITKLPTIRKLTEEIEALSCPS